MRSDRRIGPRLRLFMLTPATTRATCAGRARPTTARPTSARCATTSRPRAPTRPRSASCSSARSQPTGAVTASRSSTTATTASTTPGSNCVPQQVRSSSSASSTERASRYGRARDHRVEGVADRHDSRSERDLLAGHAIRVAGAVPVLVGRAHDLRDRQQRRRCAQDSLADDRVRRTNSHSFPARGPGLRRISSGIAIFRHRATRPRARPRPCSSAIRRSGSQRPARARDPFRWLSSAGSRSCSTCSRMSRAWRVADERRSSFCAYMR